MNLYRAIDNHGDTVDFWFSEQRNLSATKQFLSKALKRLGRPERIVIDGSGRTGQPFWPVMKPIRSRRSADRINCIEQEHRSVKHRVGPMLGFKSMASARAMLSSTAMIHMMRQGQVKSAGNQQLSLAEQFERLVAWVPSRLCFRLFDFTPKLRQNQVLAQNQ